MNGGGGVNFLRQCIPSHRLVGSTFGGGKRSIAEESAFLERVSPVECHIRKGFADGPAKMTVPAKSMPSPPHRFLRNPRDFFVVGMLLPYSNHSLYGLLECRLCVYAHFEPCQSV